MNGSLSGAFRLKRCVALNLKIRVQKGVTCEYRHCDNRLIAPLFKRDVNNIYSTWIYGKFWVSMQLSDYLIKEII